MTKTQSTITATGSVPDFGSETTSIAVNVNTWSETPTQIHSKPTATGSSSGYSHATANIHTGVAVPSTEGVTQEQPIAQPAPTQPEIAPGLLPTMLAGLPQLLPATAIIDLPPLNHVLQPHEPTVPANLDWTSLPKDNVFSTAGFGGRSQPKGAQIKYQGNIGIPWGSNILAVSPTEAHKYKYVVQFKGSNAKPWTITIWNKVGPDGKMDGWYRHSALTFVLAPGEKRYVAFDEDSEGAWGAAPGTKGLPTDAWGGWTSTWGEFSFGDVENGGWSGWDVSAIQAQIAHHNVQGMRICQADGKGCSIITPRAKKVVNAYTESKRHHDGIGGAAYPGPVRLAVDIDYQG